MDPRLAQKSPGIRDSPSKTNDSLMLSPRSHFVLPAPQVALENLATDKLAPVVLVIKSHDGPADQRHNLLETRTALTITIRDTIMAHVAHAQKDDLLLTSYFTADYRKGMDGFYVTAPSLLIPILTHIKTIRFTTLESITYTLEVDEYRGKDVVTNTINSICWAEISFPPQSFVDTEVEKLDSIAAAFRKAHLTVQDTKPKRNPVGDKRLNEWCTRFDLRNEDADNRFAWDDARRLFHHVKSIKLPSGNAGDTKTSAKFCETYHLCRSCLHPTPCHCQSESRAPKRSAGSFMDALRKVQRR